LRNRIYRSHQVSNDELKKLVEEGKSIVQIAEITGKHNVWIKEKLTLIFGSRIEFRQGRTGGIFVDNKKMNR